MHVKLEVETAPLTHLWVTLKQTAKKILFFGTVGFVNLVVAITVFIYVPDALTKRHHDPAQGIVLAWFLVIAFTLTIWANVVSGYLEGRRERLARKVTE